MKALAVDNIKVALNVHEICLLTLSQTSPGFHVSATSLLKTLQFLQAIPPFPACEKRRNCSL